jgi:hypothetical protein
MKRILLAFILLLWSSTLPAQSFEVSGWQEIHKGKIGEQIRVPLKIKNTTEKPLVLLIKRTEVQLGSSQKSLFCSENNCIDPPGDDYLLRIDPGQILTSFSIALEAGLAEGTSNLKLMIINKFNPTDNLLLELNFIIEAKPEKSHIYTSKLVTIHDVYPNPTTTVAYIDYKLHTDYQKARIVLHNLLGSPLKEFTLSPYETRVKISVEDLNSGIYFYTLYIDSEGVITRKLIVRK